MGWSRRVQWLALAALALGCGGEVRGRSVSEGGTGPLVTGGTGAATGGAGAGVGGTQLGTCMYEGGTYLVGDAFVANDGCNTCSCQSGGVVACTELGCASCINQDQSYSKLIEAAAACETDADCSETRKDSLVCGCDRWVNPGHMDSLLLASNYEGSYRGMGCMNASPCNKCVPLRQAYCASGICMAVSGIK